MDPPQQNDGLDRFSRTARELSKGPLGIIALFLVLVYAVAALVVGAGIFSTKPELLTPIVWFLAIFPVLVLLSFTFLVALVPEHLYPPSATPLHWAQFGSPPTPPAQPGGGRKRRTGTKPRTPAPAATPPAEVVGKKKKRKALAPETRPGDAPTTPPQPEEKPHDPDRG